MDQILARGPAEPTAFLERLAERGRRDRRPADRRAASTSSTTASTSRRAATSRLHPRPRDRLGDRARRPDKPPKRAGVAERDRRDFPGFYASGLWLSGSGGPIRPGFCTPGAPRPPRPQARLHRPGQVHRARTVIKHDVAAPQGGHRGQGRRGLHRRARPAQPGRGRAQRVLPERRGVHDGRRRGGPRGVPGDHRRRPDRADRRAGVRDRLDVLPGLDASRSTASTSSSASRSSTTRSTGCPRSRSASTSAGAAATGRTSTTSS